LVSPPKEGLLVFRHLVLKDKQGRVLVAHAWNPSYSGDRDQENRGSKTAWANSLQDPIWKTAITKKGLVEWLKVEG
jgi:hypothetical protein